MRGKTPNSTSTHFYFLTFSKAIPFLFAVDKISVILVTGAENIVLMNELILFWNFLFLYLCAFHFTLHWKQWVCIFAYCIFILELECIF